MRTFVCLMGVALLLGVAARAGADVTFSDDFNRPDGPIGNGWTDISVHEDMQLVGGRATAAAQHPEGGAAGITRPFSFTADVLWWYCYR